MRSLRVRPLPCVASQYSVRTKKEGTKVILQGLTGHFRAGRLTALFGSSGCGKTSLMDVLAGRKTTGTIVGEVRFNGATCLKKNIKHLCGYVEQFDNLVEARKALSISTLSRASLTQSVVRSGAQRRADAHVHRRAQAARADAGAEARAGGGGNRAAASRGLPQDGHWRRARQGHLGRAEEVRRRPPSRLSGAGQRPTTRPRHGRRRRVNIGLSLITRPPVLFLDEPTTGLDSAMADEVCAVMSLLAAQGRTVVATIHSPTASAFSLFDDLLVLRDGQLVYAGECGDAAADYFSKRVGLRPLEMGESMPE